MRIRTMFLMRIFYWRISESNLFLLLFPTFVTMLPIVLNKRGLCIVDG